MPAAPRILTSEDPAKILHVCREMTKAEWIAAGKPMDEVTVDYRPEMKMTKAAWLAEGAALAASHSESSWTIGQWVVRGEQAFLEAEPSSKKARKRWYGSRKVEWQALITQAAKATNLSEVSLRQYARVARPDVRVEGVSFAHHLEATRAHTIDARGYRHVDRQAVREILNLAKENKWTVAETRAECRRRYPIGNIEESAIDKRKRLVLNALKTATTAEKIEVLNQLVAALKAHEAFLASEAALEEELPF